MEDLDTLNSSSNSTDPFSSYYYNYNFEKLDLPKCTDEILERTCDNVVKLFEFYSKDQQSPDEALTFGSSSGWLQACFFVFLPLCIFGVIGNLLTIVVFIKFIKRTTTSIFIIALAIVDFIVCAVYMPIWLYSLFIVKFSSDFVCRLDAFLKFATVPISGCILLVIAVDRFLLIFMSRTNLITPLRAKIIVVILGVLCIAGSVPQVLTVTTIHPVPLSGTCTGEENAYCDLKKCEQVEYYITKPVHVQLWTANMIAFLVLAVAFTVVYFLIFVKVYSMYRKMTRWKTSHTTPQPSVAAGKVEDDQLTFASSGDGATSTADEACKNNAFKTNNNQANETLITNGQQLKAEKAPRKKKKLPHVNTAITLALVTGSFILAYVPMTILELAGTCAPKNDYEPLGCKKNSFQYFIWNLFLLNHIMNPIIYSFMNPRFKDALKGLITRCKRCRRGGGDGS